MNPSDRIIYLTGEFRAILEQVNRLLEKQKGVRIERTVGFNVMKLPDNKYSVFYTSPDYSDVLAYCNRLPDYVPESRIEIAGKAAAPIKTGQVVGIDHIDKEQIKWFRPITPFSDLKPAGVALEPADTGQDVTIIVMDGVP